MADEASPTTLESIAEGMTAIRGFMDDFGGRLTALETRDGGDAGADGGDGGGEAGAEGATLENSAGDAGAERAEDEDEKEEKMGGKKSVEAVATRLHLPGGMYIDVSPLGNEEREEPAPMTRAQVQQAARDKNGLAESGRYGNVHIEPNPGPSRAKNGTDGMNVGALLRSALTNGSDKAGYRELEVLEEKHIPWGRDGLTIPWDFLGHYGRHAAKIDRKLEEEGWEPKRIHGGYIEQRYAVMGSDGRSTYGVFGGEGHQRTTNTTSGAGAIGIDLDVARSQMWLHEVSPVLGYMNPVMGVMSEYQLWYGNVAPTGAPRAEGADSITENDPSLTKVTRKPVVFSMPWSLTAELLSLDAVGIQSLFEDAVESLLMRRITRSMLSGPNTGTNFAAETPSMNGVWSSGGTAVAFGAAANTTLTNFTREVVMNAEAVLRTNNAMGANPFWILGTPMITTAVNKRVGGTEAIVFVAQRTGFREGMIGGAMNGEGSRYVESNDLGRVATGKAYAQSGIGIYGFGSQMVPIFFGQGIEFRVVRLTTTTKTQYAFQVPINFALVNPNNTSKIAQAIA